MDSVSIIAYSSHDKDAVAALEILKYLVGLSLCDSFVAVPLDGGDRSDEGGATAYDVNPDSTVESGLNVLLASKGALDVVRYAAVTTFAQEGDSLSEVAEGASWLSGRIRDLTLNRVRLIECRLMVPLSTNRLTTDEFFGRGAVVNLISVPEDEIENDSIPLYADAFTDRQRAAHVAFETATVAGIWAGMNGSPLDTWGSDAAGTPATRVSFVSSAARVILDTSPELGDALDVTKYLPVPSGFLSLPPYPGVEGRAVAEAFPQELRYSPPSLSGGEEPTVRLNPLTMLREIGRLPTYAWRSVQADLYESGKENLKSILDQAGFDDIEITGDADTGQLLTEADVEAIIASAKHEASKPRPNPIPGEYWRSLICSLLGVLDGGPDGDQAREALSSRTQVLTDQARITVPSRDVTKVAKAVTGSDGTSSGPESETGRKSKEKTSTSGEESVEPKGKKPKSSKGDAGSPTKRSRTKSAPRTYRTVLTGVGTQFRASLAAARNDVGHTSEDLKRTGRTLTEWQQADIVGLIPWVLALASFLAAFALLGLTPLRETVNELVSGTVRSALYATGAALVITLSGLAILGRSGPKWHRNATIAAVFVGLIIGLVSAFSDQMLAEAGDDIGTILGVVTAGAAIWGVGKARSDGHFATARLLRRTALVFFALVFIVGATRDDSVVANLSADEMHRLAIALIVAAILMAIMAAAIVAIARVQQENAIAMAARRLESGRHRLITATDATRRLDSAVQQWAWSGTSLNYLIQYPFGQSKTTTRPEPDLDAFGLLRFQVLELELGEDGRSALLAGRLRSSTTAGWLLRQYDLAVKSFSEREARLQGLPPGAAEDFRPDEDEEPLTSDTANAVRDRSPRVAFARWLNGAEADETLATPVLNDDVVTVYKNVLAHDDNYKLVMLSGPENSHLGSMVELFNGIVPDEPRLLDPGLVTRLFSGSGGDQKMTTTVWWPTDLTTTPLDSNSHLVWQESVPFSRSGGTERLVLQAVRFDRSQSFPFHELAGTEDKRSTPFELDTESM